MKHRSRQYGFTLIELVTAVAILAILTALAWPTFQNQTDKNIRSDAVIAITNARQALVSYRSDNGGYPPDPVTASDFLSNNYLPTAPNTPPLDCRARRGYQTPGAGGGPITSCEGYWIITVTASDANSFTLTATPNPPHVDTDCTSLTLDHLNTRGYTGAAPAVNRCWSQ